MTMPTMRATAAITVTLLSSHGHAFAPAITSTSLASSKKVARLAPLLHVQTGHDRRSEWDSYAPYADGDGRVGTVGEIGCPGGGDWCFGATDDDGGTLVDSPPSEYAAASANDVAASLESLGPPRSYGLGSWRKEASAPVTPADVATPIAPEGGGSSATTRPQLRRRPIVAGNWKLNPATKGEAITLLKLLAANFVNHRDDAISALSGAPEAVIFPPLPYVADAVCILEGSGIQVGAQNVGCNEKGAFTGEIAPSMLVSSGCSYVLLGHSERRTIFGETDAHVNACLRKCLEQPALRIILCVGETLREYEGGMLERVVDAQIRGGLDGIDVGVLMADRVVIAYEPVWAIGTGLVATPDQAQAAHVAIRNSLSNHYGSEEVGASVRIQYGGSVTPESTEQLMGEMDVDGALVGGASLDADSFTRIFDGAASADARKKVQANGQYSASYLPRELVATEVLPTKNALGESPVWSEVDQALYWVSATEGEVWRWNLKDPPFRRLMGTAVGCIGLLGDSALVVAGESAMLTTSMVSLGNDPTQPIADFASGPQPLVDRPDHMTSTRPNDGRIDRYGNFVLGMYNQYHRAGATEGSNNAGLYRLNARTLMWDNILPYKFRVSNCICFSGDGNTMYFGDTPTRRVYAFDYSPDGPLTNRRLVWTMPADMAGAPDGAQVDAQGKLWIAITGGGRVVQLDPGSGEVEMVVHVDANPTSVTFGAAGLDEMFITTRAPHGGGLWRVKMPYGVRGLPEPEFK